MHKIVENVFCINIQDPFRKFFDELIELPEGTSYLSYVIKGSEKTALIDTAYLPKTEEYISRLGDIKPDYIIAQHGEPDHTGALKVLLEKFPDAVIVTNKKCKELIIDFHHIDENHFKVIEDGETLSLGDKTLEFIFAPWVHWPDTMFTYLREDKLLFTCDFLGAHYSSDNVFSNDDKKLEITAKRYWAEIMMPFRSFAQKHLAKIRTMMDSTGIEMLLPSHGAIYRNPSYILELYESWASDKTANTVLIPYVSMYGSTKKLCERLAETLEKNGVKAELFNIMERHTGDLAISLVDVSTVVLGASLILAGPHPYAMFTAYLVNALRPKTKYFSIVGSFGWGGNLTGKIDETMNALKAEKLDYVIVKGSPLEPDYLKIDALANDIIEKHKKIGLL